MQRFQDTFETSKRSFISAFSICVGISLNENYHPFLYFSSLLEKLLEKLYELKD